MSQQELLTRVIDVLERCGVRYMLTGSVASSIQGEPRMSHDIDLVVEADATLAASLTEGFPAPRYYCDPESVRDAVRTGAMSNLIDTDTGDKVDFWMLTTSAFDESRFSRRRQVEVFGRNTWISSPEDTILAKLRWAKMSEGSEKQVTDACCVYEVNHGGLDEGYLQRWVGLLGVGNEWKELLGLSGATDGQPRPR